MSVNLRALSSAWAAKFTFQLQPVSLERIDIVEAKLRDVEEELAKTKKCLAEEKAKTKKKEMVNLHAISSNVEKLNDDGQIIWDDQKHKDFELTSGRKGIRILVAGWYLLSLKVHLRPKVSGGRVELNKNGKYLDCSQVSKSDNANTSAAWGRAIYLEKEDTLEVVVTKAPGSVGAHFSLFKVGE